MEAGAAAYDKRLGLDKLDPGRTVGASKYLSLSEEDLVGMTADELSVAAVAVGNLAFQLQAEHAKHSADAKRYSNAAKRVVADVVANAPGYQYEERLLRAFRDNPTALELDRRAQDAAHKAERIAFLAKQAESSASLMMQLALSRKRDQARPRSFE